jgi:hypothetical protein
MYEQSGNCEAQYQGEASQRDSQPMGNRAGRWFPAVRGRGPRILQKGLAIVSRARVLFAMSMKKTEWLHVGVGGLEGCEGYVRGR